jgi:hypothetical protein
MALRFRRHARDGRNSIIARIAFSACLSPPRCVDRGDVDLPHFHYRLESARGFTATGGERVGRGARGDLPGEASAVPK